MAPTKEEEIKLREFEEETSPVKLNPAEKFLKAVLDVPFAFKRVDAMLYIANFDSEVNYLKKSFETLEVSVMLAPFHLLPMLLCIEITEFFSLFSMFPQPNSFFFLTCRLLATSLEAADYFLSYLKQFSRPATG
jgi:hypothetical protein